MELLRQINDAENLYRQKLEKFLNVIFRKTNLYSHGPDHHRRVWQYCRELTAFPEVSESVNDNLFAVKLILAAYLHDSGMSIDSGPRHGHLGKIFCEQFLTDNKLPVSDFEEALNAIEHHDKKEYGLSSSFSDLLKILTAADDLDAMGYTGIYRYIEIYLERKIPYANLGSMIKANVEGRFRNFIEQFGHIAGLSAKHAQRFEIISQYCSDYNKDLEFYKFGTGNPAGNCGVAEIIGIVHEKSLTLDLLFEFAEKSGDDPVIISFFRNLKAELSAILL